MFIETVDPVTAFKELIASGKSEGNSLLILTRLDSIDQDFLERYSKTFSWHFRDSERSLLTPDVSNPIYEFSYYDRIHTHFGIDQLDFMLTGLKLGSRSRVICTWDQRSDLRTKELIPCLTLLQFDIKDYCLDMSVVFRSRDIVRRLIPNWNALAKLQKSCADKLNMKPGWISDYSLKWFYRKEDFERLRSIL